MKTNAELSTDQINAFHNITPKIIQIHSNTCIFCKIDNDMGQVLDTEQRRGPHNSQIPSDRNPQSQINFL